MRKPRQEKLFNEKFNINSKLINLNEQNNVDFLIEQYIKSNKIVPNKDNITDMLSKLDLYLGSFYIKPNDVNKNLNLNLENVYQSVSKLNKRNHSENDFAYKNNEFQKVYVLKNDGKTALILVLYTDKFSPYIIDRIRVDDLFLKGNMLGSIFYDIDNTDIEYFNNTLNLI